MGFFLFLVYLALTFLRPGELFPQLEPYQIMDIASVVALAGTVLGLLGGQGPTLRAPQLYLVPLFIAWAAFSVLVTQQWLGGSWNVVLEFFRASGLVFLLAVLNVDSLPRFRVTLAVLGILAVILVGEGLAAYYLGWRSETFLYGLRPDAAGERAEGTDAFRPEADVDEADGEAAPEPVRMRSLGFLHDPNDMAQALVALLPLVVALRQPSQRLRNLVLVWLPAAVLTYGVLLTRSRGGLLALVIMLLFAFRRRMSRTLSLVVSIGTGLALLALGATGGRSLEKDESGAGRIAAWSEGLEMLKSSPVWGIGFGSFTEHHDLVAHNSFVHCFAELGLVGYFVWLSLIVLTWTQVSVLAGEPSDPAEDPLAHWGEAVRVAMVGFLVGALFLSRTYGVILFLILGLGTALGDIARREGLLDRRDHAVVWLWRIGMLEIASIVFVWIAVRLLR